MTVRLHAVPKPDKPARDNEYLAFVRSHPCCACGATESIEAHHFGPRGMSEKADDRRAVPLCTLCHRFWHDCGTLPICLGHGRRERGFSRLESEHLLLKVQVILLIEWIDR